MLCRRTECELRDATIITAVAKAIRILAKKEELSTSISHRHTLWAAELTRDGMPVKRAIDLMFLPLFEGSLEVRDSEKSIAKAAMASM